MAKLPDRPAILKYDRMQMFQTIEGFGAALTDASVMAINKLSPAVRMKVLHTLFDPHSGMNINLLRVPIGGSDFSTDFYSYLDLPKGEEDPDLLAFDASRAHPTIAMLREIREINPNLKVILTPWSPPGWMKTSDSLINGNLKPEFFDALARYLVKSIQTFEKENIPISYITIQNEPFFGNDKYASMSMSTDDQIKMIRNYLGPLLRRSGLATKILGMDHNYSFHTEGDRLYSSSKDWLAGIAYHCYGGTISQLSGSEAPIFQSECTAIEDGSSFSQTLHFWIDTQVIDGGLVGTKMALGWNVVLDETHGPSLGYCPNCRGMVDVNVKNQTFKVNPEMIAIGHVGKFVYPGAHRIASHDYQSSRFSYIAYTNPSGEVVLVAENKVDQAIALAVPDQENRYYKVTVPALGVVTITIQPNMSTREVASSPSFSVASKKIGRSP